jgi:hypothetical protein
LKELQLAKVRASLVPAAEAIGFVESFCGGFASASAGQLGRFEREFIKVTDAPSARKLRNAIHRALMESAQRYADEMSTFAARVRITDEPELPDGADFESPAEAPKLLTDGADE